MSNAAIEILTREIQKLERNISDLRQAVDTLRKPSVVSRPAQGRVQNGAVTVRSSTIDVLCDATGPMTAREIADAISAKGIVKASRNSVDVTLRRLRDNGLVDRNPDSQPMRWFALPKLVDLSLAF